MAIMITESFDSIYKKYGNKVYGYIVSKGFDKDSAADILQETFLAVWKNKSSYKARSAILTYLIGIARHKIGDEVRRRELMWRNKERLVEESNPDFSHKLENKIMVEDAISDLSIEQNELLHLIFTLGLNYREAGEVLGIPAGTVKSRMFSIRKELKQRLGDL